MSNFFKKVGSWCSTHVWQTIVIGVAVVGVVATSITLPIVLGGKNGDSNPSSTGVDKIIYGNIITMDEEKPEAQGVAIKDGKITAVGTKDEIASLAGSNTVVDDFSGKYVYPGFVDTHSHYAIMSSVLGDSLMFDREKSGEDGYELGDYEAYAKKIKTFVDANPDKEVYQAYGLWVSDNPKYPRGQTPTAQMLDDVIPTDKPIVVFGGGGHDCWLNTAAIKKYVGNYEGTDEEKTVVDKWIDQVGEDCVVNRKTEEEHLIPTGYFCETARFKITDQIAHSIDSIKNTVKYVQEGTLGKGYTTVGDCSIVETDTNKQVTAFKQLRDAGELKIKFRSYYEIREYDSEETRDAQLEYAINLAKETKGNDYFEVVGIKVFLDGVYEALSAYTLNPYTRDAGKAANYRGIQRWYGSLNDDLKELVYKANKAGLAMEFHAMGDAAVRQALDACEYAANKLEITGTPNFRNCISHLGYIDSNDIGRFKTLGVTAVVAPEWSSANKTIYYQEKMCLGEANAEQMFLIKSLIDTGANVAFHTDGSVLGGIPEMIYDATTRKDAASNDENVLHVRGEDEKITGLESLKCLTTNAAYALKSEQNIGCIKVGYAADFSVYNKDYRDNSVASSLATFNEANLLALIVNGKSLDLSSIPSFF